MIKFIIYFLFNILIFQSKATRKLFTNKNMKKKLKQKINNQLLKIFIISLKKKY